MQSIIIVASRLDTPKLTRSSGGQTINIMNSKIFPTLITSEVKAPLTTKLWNKPDKPFKMNCQIQLWQINRGLE